MSRRILLFAIICLGGCGTVEAPGPAELRKSDNVPTGRLSHTVVPVAYALNLTLVPERETFSGYVTIDVDIRERLKTFYLHASGLQVSEARLRLADGQVLEATFHVTNVAGVAEIALPRLVEQQRARLEIAYEARFGEQLKGLYRVRDGGEFYAFTQFEPVSAREAFPCFDEPVFKTPFEVTLNVAPGHAAIASMPEVERMPLENGLQRIRFGKTPPLPTYLIAFAVGPLDVVAAPDIPTTAQRSVPLPLRGIAASGKGGRLGHALGTTPELLALLEAYFDTAHPYPKLDILAVPDFASGAMENVGAITYRESLLLLGDDAPVLQRRRHALVHAHEIAHQWFGNLVTMPWWDDIWLNEAFATWMAYKTVAQWNPEHRAGMSRLVRLNAAMKEDALTTARQIRQPVTTNHDIENAFDGITYSKGGAVLSMFERYLGEESFRDAMRFHLRQFAHRNADVNDFIDSVVRTGGDQVGDAFRSFLFQPGIPMLAMNLDCSTTPTVTIGQTKFKPIGSEAKATQGWMVPVCMRYGNNDEQHESCKLVGPETTTLPLSMDHCPTWFLPNADFAGYFHWVMPASAYPGLIAAEAHLSAIEQMSIVDSINAALAAGSMSVGDAATLLEMIAKSERPQVALAAKNFIEYTRDYLVVGEETRNGLVAYVEKLYGDLPAVEAFKPDYMKELPSDSLRLFLVDVAELQAWSQDEAVRNTATHRARQWIAGHEDSLAPSSIELALRVAIADTGEEAIAPLLERFENSRDGHERKTILAAIARVTDPKLAARVRNMALGKSLRVNEIRGFLINHIKELANRPATWVWLQQNFDALISRLPPRDAGRLPAEIAGRLCDETVATEVEAYLAPRMSDLTGGPRNIAKAVETIRLCARRAEVQRPQADEFF